MTNEFFHRKYVQDTVPGRITENLEQVGKPVQCIIIDRVIYMCFLHLRILQTVNFYCS